MGVARSSLWVSVARMRSWRYCVSRLPFLDHGSATKTLIRLITLRDNTASYAGKGSGVKSVIQKLSSFVYFHLFSTGKHVTEGFQFILGDLWQTDATTENFK